VKKIHACCPQLAINTNALMDGGKSLEAKLDRILSLLEPETKLSETDESEAPVTDVGMTAYVKEINQLKKTLQEKERELDIVRRTLLERQWKSYEEKCKAPIQVPVGGSVARITRRGSVELNQMEAEQYTQKCPILPENKRGKVLFRLLKATDKKCYFLCPDFKINKVPQSTNLVRLKWVETPRRVLLIKKPRDDQILKMAKEISKWLVTQKVEVLVEPIVKRTELANEPSVKAYTDEDAGNLEEIVDFVVCLGGDGTLLWLSNLFKESVPPVISFAMGSLGFLTPFPATSYEHYLKQTLRGGFYLTLRSRLHITIERRGTAHGKKGRRGAAPGASASSSTASSSSHISKLRGKFETIAENGNEQIKKKTQRGKGSRVPEGPTPQHPELPVDDDNAEAVAAATALAASIAKNDSNDFIHESKAKVAPSEGQHIVRASITGDHIYSSPQLGKAEPKSSTVTKEYFTALNEVIVDNAKNSSLTNLDCYSDGVFTTKCQGDGLIVATPTGSTAYSLSAGGSMVHPQVPGILFTPVCPHSLSFRPIIFPDTSKISIKVSDDARGIHEVAFDGKNRQKLYKGDQVHISMSSWPVPAVCRVSETDDWFNGVRSLLHWNQRPSQKRMKEKNDPRSSLLTSLSSISFLEEEEEKGGGDGEGRKGSGK